jgi:hypothetical protein
MAATLVAQYRTTLVSYAAAALLIEDQLPLADEVHCLMTWTSAIGDV